MTPLDAALAYAKRGWLVFPCVPGSKLPAIKHGFLEATTDREKINKWWTYRKVFADRNVGVVTSRKSGIWVLDCDVDPETGELIGEQTLADLTAKLGDLPSHPIQRSPKGGSHHVFAWPDDGGDLPRRIKFAPGLDALGSRMEDGVEKAGYFVAWPSKRVDGEYRWEVLPRSVGDVMPQAPSWLIKMIRNDQPTRPEGMPRAAPVRSEKTNAYGRVALTEECNRIASCPPGSQDVTLRDRATRIGSIAAHGDIDEREAFVALVDAGMHMVNGGRPWTRREIEAKVKRFMAHGAKDPYQPRPLEPRPGKPTPPPPEETPRPKPHLIVTDQVKIAEPPKAGPDWMMGKPWRTDADGKLKPKEPINCQLMIAHHPELAGMFSYNRFADQMIINRPIPGDARTNYPREINDHDEADLTAWLNWHGISPGFSVVRAYVHSTAFKNWFDPLEMYIKSLKWDGKKRIDMWLSYYAAAEVSDYTKIIGRKYLVSAIARALDPGCKVDTMLIMEGEQGIGKSKLVRILFGDQFYSDQVGDVTNKDSAERIQGTWCVEIPEMDKFTRPEANAVKSFMSHTDDRYRAAYARNTVTRPRRCVFFGTINPDGAGYLKDSTGNRRFWPVAVSSIDLYAIEQDRDQIWAEAHSAYITDKEWWLTEDEERLALPEQDARRDDDVWEPRIREWLESRDPSSPLLRFTSADCLAGIGVDSARQGQREKIRVAKALKMFGCESRNKVAGITGRSWEFRRTK